MANFNFRDLTGQVFGDLTVLELGRKKPMYWLCQCACGNTKLIRGSSLTCGETKSCGCFRSKVAAERGRAILTKHGMSYTSIYRVRQQMNARCHNPNHKEYHNYGGRIPPIMVCDRWRSSFEAFRDDILKEIDERPSPQHSLDRIDNNGNYEPGNVRWATPEEQSNNTRRNSPLTYNGKTQNRVMWAREKGLSPDTLYSRLYVLGWSVEKALNTPVRSRQRKTPVS
jgi:hypothetical protein